MTFLLIALLIVIFLIPLWLLLGNRSQERVQEKNEDKTVAESISYEEKPLVEEFDLPEKELEKKEAPKDTDITAIGEDFELPQSISEIIPEDSPFAIYQRTLENAAYYSEQGDFETAKDLYSGLIQRISNPDIRNKINENIDYLNNYQQISATREKEKKIKELEEEQHEIKLSMGGRDFTPENIKIDITPPQIEPKIDMDQILESITEHISQINPALSESSEKIDEILNYKHELEGLKSELRSLHDLKEESYRLREQKLENDLTELQTLRDSIEKENRERQTGHEIDLLKKEIESLRSEKGRVEEQEKENEKLKQQIDELSKEISRTDERQRENQLLAQTIQELREELVNRQSGIEEVTVLKAEINELTSKLDSAESSTRNIEALEEKIATLQEELRENKATEKEIETLHDELDQRKAREEEITALHNELKQNKAREEEIAALHNELKQSKAREEEIAALHNELKQSKAREEELVALQNEIKLNKAREEELAGLKDEIKNLTRELQDKDRTEGQVEALQKQIDTLKDEVANKEAKAIEVDELKATINNLHQKLDFSETQNHELNELREKISQLENEKNDRQNELSNQENEFLKDQIKQLESRLEEVTSEQEKESNRQLEALQESIRELEKKQSGEFLDQAALDNLTEKVKGLAKDAALNEDLEEKVDQLVKNQLKQAAQGSPAEQMNFLNNQLQSLQEELKELKEKENAETKTPEQPSAPAIPDKAVIGKGETPADTEPEDQQGPSQDTNLNFGGGKKGEDKKDDFETLEDYLKGPQFDEPSEDEILEKILKEGNKKNEEDKEYEIRGTDDSEDISNEFDLSKLFAAPSAENIRDEEFYSQFMDRNRPRVKKELPILNVSYRFDKLPDTSSLSKESNVIEQSFYKYKNLLEKANEFIKRRRVKEALNYYQVVMDQDIPEEFKKMIQQNINDLNEYLQKYMINM